METTVAQTAREELVAYVIERGHSDYVDEVRVALTDSDCQMIVNGIRHARSGADPRYSEDWLDSHVGHDLAGILDNRPHFSPRFERFRNSPTGGE